MMSKYLRLFSLVIAIIAVLAAGSTVLASTDLATTFTYQGVLTSSGTGYTGTCDFQFSLFDDLTVGAPDNPIGSQQDANAVNVNSGVFAVQLNFGAGAFEGSDRYLAISVRCPAGGAGAFTPLLPRQPITPAPYAIFAGNAALATTANGLNGLTIQQNATSPNLIGGFSGNSVGPTVVGATIGGGGTNTIGTPNVVNGNYATISGGDSNTAGGAASVIGGGEENVAGSLYSVVSGGNQNSALGQFSVVSGGLQNAAGVGEWSTVPGGRGNTASGNYSFAAGRRAKAVNDGAFVWGDSTDSDISSTGVNQFIVRAGGGFWFGDTGTPTFTPGALISTSTLAYLSTAGTWENNSDVALKENFSEVDPATVLDKVAALPITSWNYIIQDDLVRHIGPMAQDFYAAFGTGQDDKHISSIDSGGVALAAIQGLYQVVQDKDAQITALQTENAELKTRLDNLDQRLAALEALASPSQAGLNIPVMLVGMLLVGSLGFVGRRFVRKGGL